jgi:hypothetical protein
MIIHPFLLAIYPITALLASNIHEIPIEEALRAYILAIGLALILLLLYWIILRDLQKAGLMASITGLLFFSYGHVYNLFRGLELFGVLIGRHRFQILIWLLLLLVSVYFIGYRLRQTSYLTQALNIAAVAALVFPLYNIVRNEFLSQQVVKVSQVDSGEKKTPSSLDSDHMPDIYYIILDAYAREDVLWDHYGFDNSEFIETLHEMGFYVADASNTNYMYSALSIGSTLNMQYVQDFKVDFNRVTYPEFMIEPTRHSLVREKLEDYGYVVVNLPSGYPATTFEDADYFITPEMTSLEVLQEGGVLNQFEGILLHTTALRILVDLQTSRETNWFAEQLEYPHHLHRIRILSAFKNLETIPFINEPKFVFAHIVIPHRPYTFGPNGEWLDPSGVFSFKEVHDLPTSEWESAYLAQLTYASTRIEKILTSIIERSDVPPIIILQSDHGPDFGLDWHNPANTPGALTYRAGILNVYYLPEKCRELLYPSITPVNSFRIVFNCAFNERYELLEDIPYFNNIRYSAVSEPWVFVPVDKIDQETFSGGK